MALVALFPGGIERKRGELKQLFPVLPQTFIHTVVIKQHWPSSFHQGQKRGGVFYTVFCTLLTGAKVQLAVRHHREHRFIHGQGITAKQGAMMNFAQRREVFLRLINPIIRYLFHDNSIKNQTVNTIFLTNGSVSRKIGNLLPLGKMIFSGSPGMDEICESLSENEVDLYAHRGYCISIQ